MLRMTTGDGWSTLLTDAYLAKHEEGTTEPPMVVIYMYFFSFMILVAIVGVSVYAAVILDYFTGSSSLSTDLIQRQDILDFYQIVFLLLFCYFLSH